VTPALNPAAYVPSLWGSLYQSLGQDEVLGAGAAGPGKTMCLLMEPLPQIFVEHQRCADPGYVPPNCDRPHPIDWGDSAGWALHLRRTLKQLVQSMSKARRMFPKIDPGVQWSEKDTTFTFSSGYKYQFGHCKDADSWEDYFSNDFTIICFDELVQFEEHQYTLIRSRCRASDPVLSKMLKVRSMSNPLIQMDSDDVFVVSNPYWVRDRFVEPAPSGKHEIEEFIKRDDGSTVRKTRLYLPATVDDNPNKQFAADYKATLASLPGHMQEALLKGNWYYVPGAYFGAEWNEALHTEQPFKIPQDWPVCRSMDWGFKNPGCILWGTLDDDENLLVIRELTFQNKTVDEVALMVREIETLSGWWHGEKSRLTGPADPQLWEERGDMGVSKAQSFARKGIPWIPGDRGNRRGSAQRMLARLRNHDHGTTRPGLVFFKNCVKCIRTIPAIPADPHDAEMPMDGGPDHHCDATRYMCSYVSRGRRGVPKMRRIADPWDDDDRKLPQAGSGYDGYGGL
jgi:hypothetical protein